MKVNYRVHQLKITFNITPEIERFVYIYLIEGKKCYLIDTGVDGSEKYIADYMNAIGRDITEIAGIFLTHSHPDHIGAASEIKQTSKCLVYAGTGEKDWIENIDRQYAERPIPNFYGLLKKSVGIDILVRDGDRIEPEKGLTFIIYETSGHSRESLSFYLQEDKILFTGDAIPVVDDVPIYISAVQSIETLNKVLALDGVEWYCPAWDEVKSSRAGKAAIENALSHLLMIDQEVKRVMENADSADTDIILASVCEKLNMNPCTINPLFRTSILSNILNT